MILSWHASLIELRRSVAQAFGLACGRQGLRVFMAMPRLSSAVEGLTPKGVSYRIERVRYFPPVCRPGKRYVGFTSFRFDQS